MRPYEVLFLAVVIAVVHLASPRLAGLIRDQRLFGSFSGGLAVGYVFLHLLPELDAGHELVGKRIYFVAMVGFTILYGFQYWLRAREDAIVRKATFALETGVSMFYTTLLVFTLGSQLPKTTGLTIVFVIALGMDLLSDDVDALKEFGDQFRNRGRYLLAGAAAIGYGLSLLRRPHEVYIDLLTAVMAGFMLYSVFHDEVPEIAKARFMPFLAGMVTFFVIHLLLGG